MNVCDGGGEARARGRVNVCVVGEGELGGGKANGCDGYGEHGEGRRMSVVGRVS
jgi:hypothetical protein